MNKPLTDKDIRKAFKALEDSKSELENAIVWVTIPVKVLCNMYKEALNKSL